MSSVYGGPADYRLAKEIGIDLEELEKIRSESSSTGKGQTMVIKEKKTEPTPPFDFGALYEAGENGMIGDIETTGMNDISSSDEPVDYSEIIEREAFLGEVPFDNIIDGIKEQFSNYIGTEDKTNYVDIFYEQIHASYNAVNNDVEEEHPAEIREALDKLLGQFVSTMKELFEQRLTISITGLEGEEVDQDEIEFELRRLYEFFIIDAKSNFKTVISRDINSKIKTVIADDRKYYSTIREMLKGYSPLVTAIGPMEFLRYSGNQDVLDMFENGNVSGNFLRKYSPKLYQFEEFEVELISHITMVQEVKEEILNGGNE